VTVRLDSEIGLGAFAGLAFIPPDFFLMPALASRYLWRDLVPIPHRGHVGTIPVALQSSQGQLAINAPIIAAPHLFILTWEQATIAARLLS
jgi:hypothetical protein